MQGGGGGGYDEQLRSPDGDGTSNVAAMQQVMQPFGNCLKVCLVPGVAECKLDTCQTLLLHS